MLEEFAAKVVAAPADHFWIGATLGLAAATGLLWYGFRRFRRLQWITNTPTSRVRSAAQGYIELKGIARNLGGEPVIAPLTLAPCTWFAYRIKERRSSGGKQSWRVVESGVSDALFALDDDTGRCVVDPEGAAVVPGERRSWYGADRHAARGRRRHQGGPLIGRMLSAGQRYRFEEEVIVDGDPLYALGEFKTLGIADPGSKREEIAELLREWKNDREALVARFDSDEDGEISVAEWEQARHAAAAEIEDRHRQPSRTEGFHCLRKSAARGHPFLIAARDEGELVARHRYAALAATLPGALALALAGWSVYLRLATA